MDDNNNLLNYSRALVKKLREIAEDPKYLSVWISYNNHGGKYDGPYYVDELNNLEQELKKYD